MFLPNYDNTHVTVTLGEIVDSGVNIWDFPYPKPELYAHFNGELLPIPWHQEEWEQKIIDHYRFHQIGQETVGRWLHCFRTRIKEIMPYYVQLYDFETKWHSIEDPLESYHLTETFEESTHGTGSQTSTGSSENTSETSGTSTTNKTGNMDHERKFSDTPQGEIGNMDNYMTEATQESTTNTENGNETSTGNATVTGSDSSESSSENTGNTSSTMTRRGNIGVQPLGTEVKNIRDAFINIDLMVINELKDLFLMVY